MAGLAAVGWGPLEGESEVVEFPRRFRIGFRDSDSVGFDRDSEGRRGDQDG